jgi:hypothetical protein
MVKGDMCLKVVERGIHKDVPIKEGEVKTFVVKIQLSYSKGKQYTKCLTFILQVMNPQVFILQVPLIQHGKFSYS